MTSRQQDPRDFSFPDFWNAISQGTNFDYVYWIEKVLLCTCNRMMGVLGVVFVCTAIILISIIGASGFIFVLPEVAHPWTLWYGFNVVWGKGRYDLFLLNHSQ